MYRIYGTMVIVHRSSTVDHVSPEIPDDSRESGKSGGLSCAPLCLWVTSFLTSSAEGAPLQPPQPTHEPVYDLVYSYSI